MENRGKNYKMLYEETLLTLSKKEEMLAQNLELLVKKEEFIEDLKSLLNKFQDYLYGFKSEKRGTPLVCMGQMGLFELGVDLGRQEELSASVPVQEEVVPKRQPKKRAKGTGRMPLPENLPRVDEVIEPLESTENCVMIGKEITEVLEVNPATFYVRRYIRPKYARPNGGGILIGVLPDRAIEKGIPSESVIAQLTVDKYVYGMPLHRQIDKYGKMGVRIPASSASDWIMGGWRIIRPLWELLRLVIQNQKYLQVDESPVKVLDRDHKNGIHQGYMWLYHAPVERLVLFDYRKGRDQSGPKEMLEAFTGIIQTDGYSVYEALFANHMRILLAFCMAHARRKFVDALKDNHEQANHVLDRIQVLYLLEKKLREQGADWVERTAQRKEHAIPVLAELGKWFEENHLKYRPTSPMGKAISYARARWDGLSAYALHGQMEIDNNLVENAVRPLAVGRKAYLFAGSHQAAEMAAAMYSFMASCKKNNLNEFEWLKDVLQRIQSHKQNDLYQLLPSNWEKFRLEKQNN
jgi:transposase